MAIEHDGAGVESAWPTHESPSRSRFRWYHRAVALLYVFFCFEIGVFLLLFPWLDVWQQNYFSTLSPGWYQFWSNAYVRGAVSGLGLVDIAISFSGLFRLRRLSRSE